MSAFETGNKLKVGPNGEELTKTSLTTWSHNVVDIADPDPSAILIDDIAHGLSMHVRWAGQGLWLSVAQHCVMVVRYLEERVPWANESLLQYALMHDAHEAYLGDMSGGLKWLLRDSELPRIASRLDIEIDEALGGGVMYPTEDEHAALKEAEQHLVEIEYDLLFHDVRHSNIPIEGPLCQKLAEALFLEEAKRLGLSDGSA